MNGLLVFGLCAWITSDRLYTISAATTATTVIGFRAKSEEGSTVRPESEPGQTPGGLTSKPESAAEPEGGTTQPESEANVTPEAEATPKPESEANATPEAEVTAKPESEANATPEAEATAKPESEANVTPEAEATAKPESEANATPEAEVTAKPESEANVTPEAEATAKPESEANATPEVEVTPKPESEVTSKPECEVTSEPESEATSKPESEATSKPENEPTSKPESEATSKPESEARDATAKPESLGSSEPATSETEDGNTVSEEGGAEPEKPLGHTSILLPPLGLVLVIVLGLLLLSMFNHNSYCRSRCNLHRVYPETTRKVNIKNKTTVLHVVDLVAFDGDNGNLEAIHTQKSHEYNTFPLEDEPLLSKFDLEVLDGVYTFYNKPKELLYIATPALISLSLCPAALYMYTPLAAIFWPPAKYSAQPNINDAIACFLAPAGLVYATSFGFAFQSALAKQSEILKKLSHEVGLIDHIVTLTAKLSLPIQRRLEIYRATKAEAIFMALQIQDKQPEDFVNPPKENVKARIWTILDILKDIRSLSEFDAHVNQVMVKEIIGHIMSLNSICSDRLGILHVRIHWLKWMFLETLGFFSFFGVLLLDTKSQTMNLAMCVITVFSISLLCFVVSDFDSPFSGFFRIELDVLLDVVDRIIATFDHANKGENVHWTYPDVTAKGCFCCLSK